jgi:hypothetical protein
MYAPFTLAAIPIGSFKPEPMMQHVHMGPGDAIKVHMDLKKPRLSVGIHWGTFMMSDEHYLEPPQTLARLWKQQQDQQTHWITDLGIDSTLSLPSPPKDSKDIHDPHASTDCAAQCLISPSTSSTTTSSNETGGKAASTDHQSQFVTTAFGETVVID